MPVKGQVLIAGRAKGEVMRFDAPISFWGGIDNKTSRVTLAGHPQLGQAVAGKILLIPNLIGSSSSSAILLELIYRDLAPCGLILGHADAILPIGVIVATQMEWPSIPVLVATLPDLVSGESLEILQDGTIQRL